MRSLKLLSIALVCYLAFVLWQGAERLPDIGKRDYAEAFVLEVIRSMHQGWGMLFRPINQGPYYLHSHYNPLFYFLAYPFFDLWGNVPSSVRFPSFMFLLMTAVFIAGIAYRRFFSGNVRASALAGAAFLLPPYLVVWATFGRVDSLALGLTAGGIWAIARQDGQKGMKLAILLWVLAFWAKQNFILAPLAALFAACSLPSMRPMAKRYAAMYAAGILFPALTAQLLTDGEYFRHIVIYAAATDWRLDSQIFWKVIFPFLATAIPMYACIWMRRQQLLSDQSFWTRMILAYFVLSQLSLLSILKDGAWINYLYEPWLGAFLLGSHAWAMRGSEAEGSARWRPALAVGVLVVASFLLWTQEDFPDEYSGNEARELMQLFQGSTRDILTDDVMLTALSGKRVVIDPFQFDALARKGHWDPLPLAQDCRNRRFSLIQMGTKVASLPGIRECVNDHYVFYRRGGPWGDIYVPRDEAPRP